MHLSSPGKPWSYPPQTHPCLSCKVVWQIGSLQKLPFWLAQALGFLFSQSEFWGNSSPLGSCFTSLRVNVRNKISLQNTFLSARLVTVTPPFTSLRRHLYLRPKVPRA